MSNRLKVFIAISIGGLLALSLNLLAIFFLALFNVEKACIVYINYFTEGVLEAFVFPVLFIMGVVALVMVLREVE